MISDDQILQSFNDDPDLGIDAASDKGYWLEATTKECSDQVIAWRKKVGMSRELLSQMAPIPLEEYLKIERGERFMTNGDCWRIDTAIIKYILARETWLERRWRRGWHRHSWNSFRRIWKANDLEPLIFLLVGMPLLYFSFVRPYSLELNYFFRFFLRSALTTGIPVCLVVGLIRWVFKDTGS